MPFFAVKKTFLVEVVQMVPAGDKSLAESVLTNKFMHKIEELCEAGFILTTPDHRGVDCDVVDLFTKLEELWLSCCALI